MKITGAKRWFVLVIISLLSGTMVYTPFLRYNYYDQMIITFTEYKPIVDAAVANSFIGDLAFAFGIVVMIFYVIGGPIADKFSEKYALAVGGLIMAAGTFYYAAIPSAPMLIAIHVVFAIGTGILWAGYIKLTRKLGTESEQSRMFSTSEFIRGILGTALGFLGVGILDQAILPSGLADPTLVGQQFSMLLIVNGILFVVLSIAVLVLVPKDVIGLEVEDGNQHEDVKLSVKSVKAVLKMPGTWLVAMIIFFCFSFTSAGNGYLGAFTTEVLGVSTTTASSFAIIRNYIIAALSTLAIGFIAAKIGSEVKTLGFYLFFSTILTIVMLLTIGNASICIAVTFVFAAVYTGMRGIYFAQLHEVNIPVELTGVATGIISLVCYLPDVYFAKLAGYWLDSYGAVGYNYIWYWAIGCGLLGMVTVAITLRYIKKLKKQEAAGIDTFEEVYSG